MMLYSPTPTLHTPLPPPKGTLHYSSLSTYVSFICVCVCLFVLWEGGRYTTQQRTTARMSVSVTCSLKLGFTNHTSTALCEKTTANKLRLSPNWCPSFACICLFALILEISVYGCIVCVTTLLNASKYCVLLSYQSVHHHYLRETTLKLSSTLQLGLGPPHDLRKKFISNK